MTEVVGGHGRIGSLFLRERGSMAVPRGVAPGCLTAGDVPIIVAVPSEEWSAVLDATPSHRRSDLVWVGDNYNRNAENATVVIPRFTVEEAGSDPVVAVTAPTCSFVFGKHSAVVAAALTSRGVLVQVVESWTELCNLAVHGDTSIQEIPSPSAPPARLIPIPAIDLVCCGADLKIDSRLGTGGRAADVQVQSAIVVGGGIIGSSIARALIQRGVEEVTVYDPTPAGKTTAASWAWLNANQKPPPSYRSLNQLGLRGWRSDALLQSLPSWSGTLVRTPHELDLAGGYTAEGPLSVERIRELEPEANFTDTSGYVYYFADEGHVNPRSAVLALRREAAGLGASFVSDAVGSLLRNHEGRVVGVRTSLGVEKRADVVIVAAGAKSSDAALGKAALVHNPSMTYFASPQSASSSTAASSPHPPALGRILMDQVRALYVAQRKDGTLVAGGGSLKKGLGATLSPDENRKQLTMARQIAQELAPNPVGNSTFTHKEEVVSKPMPRDGFPIMGYVEAGLYSAVTHSGMTMAPLLGQLVAAEVKEQVSLSLLDDYRPGRFDEKSTQEQAANA